MTKYIIDINFLDQRPGGEDWTKREYWPDTPGIYYCREDKTAYVIGGYVNYLGIIPELIKEQYIEPEQQISESLFLKSLAASNGHTLK